MKLLTAEQYENAPAHIRKALDAIVNVIEGEADNLSDGYGYYLPSAPRDDCMRGIAMDIIAQLADQGWHTAQSNPEGK